MGHVSVCIFGMQSPWSEVNAADASVLRCWQAGPWELGVRKDRDLRTTVSHLDPFFTKLLQDSVLGIRDVVNIFLWFEMLPKGK